MQNIFKYQKQTKLWVKNKQQKNKQNQPCIICCHQVTFTVPLFSRCFYLKWHANEEQKAIHPKATVT